MGLSRRKANELEYSIYHYFLWRHETEATETRKHSHANVDKQRLDDTLDDSTVDSSTSSDYYHDVSNECYQRIADAIKENLQHVIISNSGTLLSSDTPEVYFRWTKYTSLCDAVAYDTKMRQNNKKRKIDDLTENQDVDILATTKNSAKKVIITKISTFAAKEAVSSVRLEYNEAKELAKSLESKYQEATEIEKSLETKLAKSEVLSHELWKTQRDKELLEKELEALLASNSADTTDQNRNVDHNGYDEEEKDVESTDKKRKTLEKQKFKMQLRESKIARAIIEQIQEEKVPKSTVHRDKWEAQFEKLVEFHKEFGHCRVPSSNPSLRKWCQEQRGYYRRRQKTYSAERKARLDALGFEWSPNRCGGQNRSFQAYLEQCKAFLEKHGHLRVPLMGELNEDGTEPTEEETRFRIWAQLQRIQYQKLCNGVFTKLQFEKDRIRLLDSLGFQWKVDATNEEGDNIAVDIDEDPRELQFRNRIEQLRKVKETYGCFYSKKNILSIFPNKEFIYNWVKGQRQEWRKWVEGKRSSITDQRRDLLLSIEFDQEAMRDYLPTMPANF